jgi:membrane carboxypeptidase/penicillin-binding protein PbpC
VTILYPLDGDRYLLDPAGADSIPLRAACDRPVREVTWFVDGLELATVGPPYEARWPLSRGPHRIVAAVPGGAAHSVEVRVE